MSHPTPRAISAALEAMTAESALWTREGERLQQVANRTNALLIDVSFSSVILDDFLTTYNAVCRRYTELCSRGRDAAGAIAGTLAAVAQTYADEEQRNLHAQYRLY